MHAHTSFPALALLGALVCSPACSPEGAPGFESHAAPPALLAADAPKGASPERAPSVHPSPPAPAEPEPAPVDAVPAAAAPVGAEGPQLRALEPTYPFGSVYEGALVLHTFELESSGTADLVVTKIKPGCGCTAADPIVLDADGTRRPYAVGTPLPPGTRLLLDVTFDTFGQAGPHAKSINVYCTDPRGVERLALTGRVEPFLNVVPNALRLGRLTIAESRTDEVTLTTRGGDPVLLHTNPDQRPAFLAVVLTPKNPDAEGRSSSWTAAVTLGGEGLHEGPFQFRVPVSSDVPNPNAPEGGAPERAWLGGMLFVQADVLGLYALSPREMFFGPLEPDTAASRTVKIDSYAAAPPVDAPRVRLLGPDGEPLADADRYHTTVAKLDPGAGWTVELLIDGLPAAYGIFAGQVVVETQNADQPEIAIPFKGVVR